MKATICGVDVATLLYNDRFVSLEAETKWCYLALLFVTWLCKFRPTLCIEPGIPYSDQQIAVLLGMSTYAWRTARARLLKIGYVKEEEDGSITTPLMKYTIPSSPYKPKENLLVPKAVKPEKASEAVRTKEEERLLIKKIINHLNNQTGKRFKYFTAETTRFVKGRLMEGATLKDFKTCINNKAKQWNGTDMNIYLRPSTLFQASKFWGYVNELQLEGPKEGDKGRELTEGMTQEQKEQAHLLGIEWEKRLKGLKERMGWKTDEDVDWMQVPPKNTWVKEQMRKKEVANA